MYVKIYVFITENNKCKIQMFKKFRICWIKIFETKWS